LIVTGALVGASGAILSYIMCKGMNRSIINVLLAAGARTQRGGRGRRRRGDRGPVKAGSPEDAAYIMKNAGKIIVVPVTAWRWRRRSRCCARWATS
jgi:NAD(P) transhydrogenase subunit beta